MFEKRRWRRNQTSPSPPPISLLDYRPLANHPNGKIPYRSFKVEEVKEETEDDPLEGGGFEKPSRAQPQPSGGVSGKLAGGE